jgi:SAM-dependent methyltransferase
VGHTVALDLSFGMAPNVCADAQQLPFPGHAFDVVLAPHVLYHVRDVPTAAREARRVLRPDGCFVAVTVARRSNPQLRDLVEGAVGTGWTWGPPPGFSFGLEDGHLLEGAFSTVELVPTPEGDVLVRDANLVADYVWSFGDVYERSAGVDWDGVVERVRAGAQRVIAESGVLRLSPVTGAFMCR